jgi:hypothetical protein
MSKDEIAESVAEVGLLYLSNSIDWRIADDDAEGDEYLAIHAELLFRTVEKMYMSTKRTYYEVK